MRDAHLREDLRGLGRRGEQSLARARRRPSLAPLAPVGRSHRSQRIARRREQPLACAEERQGRRRGGAGEVQGRCRAGAEEVQGRRRGGAGEAQGARRAGERGGEMQGRSLVPARGVPSRGVSGPPLTPARGCSRARGVTTRGVFPCAGGAPAPPPAPRGLGSAFGRQNVHSGFHTMSPVPQ